MWIDRCGKKVYSRRVSLTRSLSDCIRGALRLCARRRGVAHPFLSAPSHGNVAEAFARTVSLEYSTPHSLPTFLFASLNVSVLFSLLNFAPPEELDGSVEIFTIIKIIHCLHSYIEEINLWYIIERREKAFFPNRSVGHFILQKCGRGASTITKKNKRCKEKWETQFLEPNNLS